MPQLLLSDLPEDVKSDPAVRLLVQQPQKNRVVILPFYGEFGIFITSFVRLVHFIQADIKVVCCKKGEEALFPSADEYFYGWEDIFQDNMKCGVRNDWPATTDYLLSPKEEALKFTLSTKYPGYEQLSLDYVLPNQAVSQLIVPIKPVVHYEVRPDVVVGARKRLSIHPLGDSGKRNFNKWPVITDSLVRNGYSIGQIGQQETSCVLEQTAVASWQLDRPMDGMISMLRHCKLYIGTDTGLTHLAVLLGTPTICFRCYDGSLDLIESLAIPVAQRMQSYIEFVPDGWTQPTSVLRSALKYLHNCD